MPPVSSSAFVARRARLDREEAKLTLASQRLRDQWLYEARAAAFLGCIHSLHAKKPLAKWTRTRPRPSTAPATRQPRPAANPPQSAAEVIEISSDDE